MFEVRVSFDWMWTKMPQRKFDDISKRKIYIRGHFKGAMSPLTHARADENSLSISLFSYSLLYMRRRALSRDWPITRNVSRNISKQATSFLHETNCLQSPARSITSTNSSELCYYLLPTPVGWIIHLSTISRVLRGLSCEACYKCLARDYGLPMM